MKAKHFGTTVATLALLAAPLAQAAPQVVELNQAPCQFLESEHGANQGYKSTKIQDCEAIDAKTGDERLAKSKTISLKPGEYVYFSYRRPSDVFAPYGSAALDAMAKELDPLFEKIVHDAAGK